MKITKPGIFRNFDTEAYFNDPCETPSLTQSLAKILIAQSPLHAFHAHPRLAVPAAGEDDGAAYNKNLAIGNAAHSLMLGRGKAMALGDFDNWMKKEAKEFRAEALAAGKEPILRKHFAVAEAMVNSAIEQLEHVEGCENTFCDEGGDSEVVIASCEAGLWLRSMIDWITPDLRNIWDYKTSGQSASPYATGKLMASAGWHIQAAMHERILDVIDPDGAGRRRFFYVCQENTEPFALTVNEIGESALTIGRKQIDYAITIWRRCVETDTWPAYPLRIIRPELPGWAEASWIDREIQEYEAEVAHPTAKNFDPRNLMAG